MAICGRSDSKTQDRVLQGFLSAGLLAGHLEGERSIRWFRAITCLHSTTRVFIPPPQLLEHCTRSIKNTQYYTCTAVWTHGLKGNYHYVHQGWLVLKGGVAAILPEIFRKK